VSSVNAASSEVAETAQSMHSNSQSLARLAENLDEMVSKFKI